MEKWRQIRNTFNEKGLKKTLLEGMLWGLPATQSVSVNVDGSVVRVDVLAELPGAAFLQTEAPSSDATGWFKQVDRELAKHFPERLIRFQHSKEDSWFWPKKLASGSLSYERLITGHNQLPDYLAQRLAGLAFTAKDHQTLGAINPVSVKEKIRGQFESSKVTSDFFKKFKEKHEFLTNEITGIPSVDEASSYSTVILNRLMFIYFLQKKEFLNGDPNYLKTCLTKVQDLKGKDKFYSFYKDYLLELFFNKLDNPTGKISDPVIQEIAGDVPYVNGGVFSQSVAESKYKIDIPDSAFEEIFGFFDSYTWHLDTRPTGTPNEINPEVIGYIFEQYINFTADGKKENGAYYTKHDVTGYIASSVIVPGLLDHVVSMGISITDLLCASPDLFIPTEMLHGWDEENECWKYVDGRLEGLWEGDPVNWSELDLAPSDLKVCLPEETWVEVFHRRDRVEQLRVRLRSRQVSTVNELVSENLDLQAILRSAVSIIDSTPLLEKLWEVVSGFRVIDPTCGSGAFLFAALEIFEDTYSAILDALRERSPDSKPLVAAQSHPNLRYFIRKHSALNNLYGTDIMEDAIETAKLRIFLSLVSCLDERNQIEPLPDLDFNLRCGNLLVGFTTEAQALEIEEAQLLSFGAQKLRDLVSKKATAQKEFVALSTANDPKLHEARKSLESISTQLRSHADEMYANFVGMTELDFASWAESMKPLHWISEFPDVMNSGGFDAIIGNPPYIQRSKVSKLLISSLLGYQTKGFTDLFEACHERSLGLLNETGRHGMVVMSSLARGEKCKELRKLVSSRKMAEWWSTYSIRPSSLFTGIKVRNAILILGPGHGTHTTANRVFSSASRAWLFPTLEYASTQRESDQGPVRGGVAQGLAETMMERDLSATKGQDREIFFRRSGKYWMPVLLGPAKFFSQYPGDPGQVDTVAASARLAEGEAESVAIAVSGSKLGYFNWALLGDDFNVSGHQTSNTRRLALQAQSKDPELEPAANQLLSKAVSQVVLSEYNGALYLNVLWNNLSKGTDSISKMILSANELRDQERPLHIWFRQTVRISRDDSHRVAVSEGFVKDELGWDWLIRD
jgi:hypothetical protein